VHFIILTSLLFLDYSILGKMMLSSPCVDLTMHCLQTFTQAKFQIQFEKYTPYTSKDGQIRKVSQNTAPRWELSRSAEDLRLLSSIHFLGLVLSWTRTQGSYAVLQVIFGLTPGQLSLWLQFSRRLLVKVLRDDPLAKVTVPTHLEICNFEAAIASKYPALTNCWRAMDGLTVA
jgi:hypothetical protein